MTGIVSIVGAGLGFLLVLGGALAFAGGFTGAGLFLAGLGILLLGAGGMARVSWRGAAIAGSSGFVLMVLGAIVPSVR